MFRDDIEGLRAVSVLLVVAFHARLGGLTGGFVGVDVFFVISGYLITQLLVRELERTGGLSLRGFYARRARRLLPLSCLVIVATAIGAGLLLPPLDRAGVAGDLRSSALFYANWSFAGAATEYMADTQASPVLHFWSLSVEEQFYVVWPLVLVVAAGRAPGPRRRRLAIAIGVIGLASLLASALVTSIHGPYAYFGIHTRAWELALGGGLALARGAWLPPRLAGASAALGLGLIGGAALVIDEATAFPGLAALAPCLGAALVIAGDGRGAGRLLGHAAPRYLGRLSYAWYLWHWPCLVLLRGPLGPALSIALSFGLAVASHHLVEQPLRRSRWLAEVTDRSLALGATLTLVSVLAGTSLPVVGTLTGEPALMPAYHARIDQPRGVTGCYARFEGTTAATGCTFGDPHGQRAVALIGDSHAHAWFPAVDRWARARGYRLHFWAKLACPMVDVPVWQRETRRPYTECTAWRRAVLARLRALAPLDLVIVGRSHWYSALLLADGARIPEAASEAVWQGGIAATLGDLTKIAARVVLLRAVPRAPRDVPACISERPSDVHHCDFHHDPATWNDRHIERAEAAAAAARPGVALVDMTRAVCPADPCSVYAADGTIIFRDHHHLTATFAASLWSRLGERLDAAAR